MRIKQHVDNILKWGLKFLWDSGNSSSWPNLIKSEIYWHPNTTKLLILTFSLAPTPHMRSKFLLTKLIRSRNWDILWSSHLKLYHEFFENGNILLENGSLWLKLLFSYNWIEARSHYFHHFGKFIIFFFAPSCSHYLHHPHIITISTGL